MNPELNYYESLSPAEQAEWDREQKHLWEVKLPADLCKERKKAEAEWSKSRQTYAWIGAEDWNYGWIGFHFLNEPTHACRRIIRLSLPRGGQLRIIHEFLLYHDRRAGNRECEGDKCMCHFWPVQEQHDYRTYADRTVDAYLVATTTADADSLHRWRGTQQETYPAEMTASAVVFSPLAPQHVVDNCAKILDASTHGNGENFYALLDGSTRCAICRHPLRDEVSKLVGVGPDCAKVHGIPHTLAVASRRLELRKKLLGE